MEITIIWRFIVGIDISKKYLDIYLFDRKTGSGFDYQVLNTKEGFSRLAQWLEDHKADKSQTKLISEYTGRYGEHLVAVDHRPGLAACGGEDYSAGQSQPGASPQVR